MILKQADDRSRRVALLRELQQSTNLDAFQRNWLRDELQRLERGIQGERDAAHYIDNVFRNSDKIAVIHDLRISVDGEVAQIDHLLVHRALRFYLLESKNYNGNVQINDRGEFSVSYGQERLYGIESPLEQSRRHERVLRRLLDKLGIAGRGGLPLTFHHAVLFHPRAVITRPDRKAFDSDNVIKADQIGTWIQAYNDKDLAGLSVLGAVMNLHSMEATQGWAEQLIGCHRPAPLFELPEFMKPKAAPVQPPSQPLPTPPLASPPVDQPAAPDESLRRKLICVTCHQKISFAEGKFCWSNEKRFGGFQYCRAHQAGL